MQEECSEKQTEIKCSQKLLNIAEYKSEILEIAVEFSRYTNDCNENERFIIRG